MPSTLATALDAADGVIDGKFYGKPIVEAGSGYRGVAHRSTGYPVTRSAYRSSTAEALDAADGVIDGKFYGRRIVEAPGVDYGVRAYRSRSPTYTRRVISEPVVTTAPTYTRRIVGEPTAVSLTIDPLKNELLREKELWVLERADLISQRDLLAAEVNALLAEREVPKEIKESGNCMAGLEIKMLDDAYGNKDNVVVCHSVSSGGPAQIAGLQPGDIIASWSGIEMDSKAKFASMFKVSSAGDVVCFGIVRNGVKKDIHVTLAPIRGKTLKGAHKVKSTTKSGFVHSTGSHDVVAYDGVQSVPEYTGLTYSSDSHVQLQMLEGENSTLRRSLRIKEEEVCRLRKELDEMVLETDGEIRKYRVRWEDYEADRIKYQNLQRDYDALLVETRTRGDCQGLLDERNRLARDLATMTGELRALQSRFGSEYTEYRGRCGRESPSAYYRPASPSPRPESPAAYGRPYLGVEIKMLDDANGNRDSVVVVHAVNRGGPAAEAGIVAGDIIKEWEGLELDSKSKFSTTLRDTAPGTTVWLTIVRNSKALRLPVTIGSR